MQKIRIRISMEQPSFLHSALSFFGMTRTQYVILYPTLLLLQLSYLTAQPTISSGFRSTPVVPTDCSFIYRYMNLSLYQQQQQQDPLGQQWMEDDLTYEDSSYFWLCLSEAMSDVRQKRVKKERRIAQLEDFIRGILNEDGSGWLLVPGPAGPQGPRGAPGALGPVGPAGSRGPTGFVGPLGFTGLSGSQGGTGSTGATGNGGLRGPNGSPGPRGATGLPGVVGQLGVQGPLGPGGTAGSSGPPGPPGARGPPSEICRYLLDLAFIVDSVITPTDWTLLMQFLADFIECYDIGTSKTRISLVRYASGGTNESVIWYLDKYQDLKSTKNAFLNTGFQSGTKWASLVDALQTTETEVFGQQFKQITTKTKVAVIIAPGYSGSIPDVKASATGLKSSGVAIVGVGVMRPFSEVELRRQLEVVVSDSSALMIANGYADLNNTAADLFNATCIPPI